MISPRYFVKLPKMPNLRFSSIIKRQIPLNFEEAKKEAKENGERLFLEDF